MNEKRRGNKNTVETDRETEQSEGKRSQNGHRQTRTRIDSRRLSPIKAEAAGRDRVDKFTSSQIDKIINLQ